MEERFPAVKTWEQIRPAVVRDYVSDLERRELSYYTIRLRLAPIKLTWRYMAENHPEFVTALPKIKIEAPLKTTVECLEVEEVDALLDWMRIQTPDIWPIACLHALCGLRVLEAIAKRVQDNDLKAQTVTVTDTGHHKPKTRDSFRTIPVCHEVIAALQTAMASQKVRPVTGELFTTKAGTLWRKDSICQRGGNTLKKAARDLNNQRFETIPARKLRAAFATMADRLGAHDRLLKTYLGHAQGDMLGGHYRRIDIDELRSVSVVIEGRKRLYKEVNSRQNSGKIR